MTNIDPTGAEIFLPDGWEPVSAWAIIGTDQEDDILWKEFQQGDTPVDQLYFYMTIFQKQYIADALDPWRDDDD